MSIPITFSTLQPLTIQNNLNRFYGSNQENDIINKANTPKYDYGLYYSENNYPLATKFDIKDYQYENLRESPKKNDNENIKSSALMNFHSSPPKSNENNFKDYADLPNLKANNLIFEPIDYLGVLSKNPEEIHNFKELKLNKESDMINDFKPVNLAKIPNNLFIDPNQNDSFSYQLDLSYPKNEYEKALSIQAEEIIKLKQQKVVDEKTIKTQLEENARLQEQINLLSMNKDNLYDKKIIFDEKSNAKGMNSTEEVEQLKSELVILRKKMQEYSEIESELFRLRQKDVLLNREFNDLRLKYNEISIERDTLKNENLELNNLKLKYEKEYEVKGVAEAHIKMLNQKIQDLVKERDQAIYNLAEKDHIIQEAYGKMQIIENEIKLHKQNKEAIKSSGVQKENMLNEKDKKISDLNWQMKKLSDEKTKIENELKNLIFEKDNMITSLIDKVQSMDKLITIIEIQYNQCHLQITELNKKQPNQNINSQRESQLINIIIEKENEIKLLIDQNQQYKSVLHNIDINSMENKMSKNDQKTEVLQENIQALQLERENLLNQILIIEKKLNDYELKIDKLQILNENLKIEIQNNPKSEYLNDLEEKNKKMIMEIKDLRQKLDILANEFNKAFTNRNQNNQTSKEDQADISLDIESDMRFKPRKIIRSIKDTSTKGEFTIDDQDDDISDMLALRNQFTLLKEEIIKLAARNENQGDQSLSPKKDGMKQSGQFNAKVNHNTGKILEKLHFVENHLESCLQENLRLNELAIQRLKEIELYKGGKGTDISASLKNPVDGVNKLKLQEITFNDDIKSHYEKEINFYKGRIQQLTDLLDTKEEEIKRLNEMDKKMKESLKKSKSNLK